MANSVWEQPYDMDKSGESKRKRKSYKIFYWLTEAAFIESRKPNLLYLNEKQLCGVGFEPVIVSLGHPRNDCVLVFALNGRRECEHPI